VVHFNIILWYHHSPFQSCQHDPSIVEYVAGLRNSERNHRTTAKKCSPLWFWFANKDVLSPCAAPCHRQKIWVSWGGFWNQGHERQQLTSWDFL
jgi:hypothetical protein